MVIEQTLLPPSESGIHRIPFLKVIIQAGLAGRVWTSGQLCLSSPPHQRPISLQFLNSEYLPFTTAIDQLQTGFGPANIEVAKTVLGNHFMFCFLLGARSDQRNVGPITSDQWAEPCM